MHARTRVQDAVAKLDAAQADEMGAVGRRTAAMQAVEASRLQHQGSVDAARAELHRVQAEIARIQQVCVCVRACVWLCVRACACR